MSRMYVTLENAINNRDFVRVDCVTLDQVRQTMKRTPYNNTIARAWTRAVDSCWICEMEPADYEEA